MWKALGYGEKKRVKVINVGEGDREGLWWKNKGYGETKRVMVKKKGYGEQ